MPPWGGTSSHLIAFIDSLVIYKGVYQHHVLSIIQLVWLYTIFTIDMLHTCREFIKAVGITFPAPTAYHVVDSVIGYIPVF